MRHAAATVAAATSLLVALLHPAASRAQSVTSSPSPSPSPSGPATDAANLGAPRPPEHETPAGPTVAPVSDSPARNADPTDALAPGVGRLRVVVNRPDTRVVIDDREAGIAPVEQDLPAGHHRVRISSPGEKSWEGDVDVAAGMLTPLRATLRPSPSRSSGIVISVFSAMILTGGTVVGVLSNQDRAALDADRSAGILDDRDGRIQRGQIFAGLADGAFVLSVAVGAIAVYLFAHDSSPPSEARPGRRRVLPVAH